MKESQFGFHYTWADLQPVRPLAVTVFAAQIIGMILGWLFGKHPELFMKLWFGGALATLPAFLLGLVVQKQMRPGSISENSTMVWRMGLVATAITLVAIAFPNLGVK
jgi:undecaprenyl pyrophosphate phosphatase UppP